MAGRKQVRVLLEVVCPVGHVHRGACRLGGFNGILIHGRVDQAKIVEDLGSLGALPRPKKAGDRDRRKEGDDCHDNHDFHQREAGAFGCEFL